ncbi:ABC transporter ATP-binding protein [Streptomyces sp. XD-27]|uniref:ATP-binding cassette domain-containing protein n=1 Tax=Streptomyces sp. XD-27 TaxID=3062779 RepID=UPI0026F47BF4|nr:ABC transporter ATP-binding protein [Streptomyces sp. XD-27]WKX74069.1 ABC transporter ATP-binding protein [Streptomyces sp. XD-27]
MDEPDGAFATAQRQFATSFLPHAGGHRWRVVHGGVEPEHARRLESELDALQRRADDVRRQLAARQWELYAIWRGSVDDGAPEDLAHQLTRELDATAEDTVAAEVKGLKRRLTTMLARLPLDADGNPGDAASRTFLQRAQMPAGWRLVREDLPPFHRALDPVVLLTLPQKTPPLAPADGSGPLVCRTTADLPPAGPNETADLSGSAPLDDALARQAAELQRAVRDTADHPGVRTWTHPWHPLYLEWQVGFRPVDCAGAGSPDWTFMAPFLTSWYREITDRIKATHRRAAPRVLRVTLLGATVSGLMLAATWAALGWLAATGRMDLALAATAVVAVRTSTGALTSLVMAAARLFRTSLYLEDWQAFLRRAKALRTERGTEMIPLGAPAVIEAKDVTCTYPGADVPAVDGISLTLRQGELIALVGENGSGMTTLSTLLTGLRVASTGTVTWDGTDRPHSVWSCVGLVPQDYTRWPMDLRANIHLGQPRTADDVLLLEAARAAGADSVIAKVPYGLDPLVPGWGEPPRLPAARRPWTA